CTCNTLNGIRHVELPTSLRWLLLRAVQGKASLLRYKEKSIAGLNRLRGRPAGDKVSEKKVEETLVSLKDAYADQDSEGRFWEVFRGLILKAIIIGVGLVLFLQILIFLGRRPLLIEGVSGI
ncbi:hypothetical protein C5167_048155, partial [Papaver somniferum]